jgi:hypothetical protein
MRGVEGLISRVDSLLVILLRAVAGGSNLLSGRSAAAWRSNLFLNLVINFTRISL